MHRDGSHLPKTRERRWSSPEPFQRIIFYQLSGIARRTTQSLLRPPDTTRLSLRWWTTLSELLL
jgi:hypothetical protein